MSGHIPDRLERLLEGDIREKLGEYDDAVSRDYATQSRDGTVRTSMIREAHNELDEVPDQITQWYDPDQNVIVMLLPDDEGERETPERGDESNPSGQKQQDLNAEILNTIQGPDAELLAGMAAEHFDQIGQLEQEAKVSRRLSKTNSQ